jgi:hypothetical protein
MNNKLDVGDLVEKDLKKIDELDNNFNEVHSILNKTIDERLSADLKFSLNSINILCGMTGSGKTRLIFFEIAKLKYIKHNYIQFIYITDEECLETYLKYRELIPTPIIKIKYIDAYNEISNIVKIKNLYEDYKNKKCKLDKEQINEIKDYLDITDDKIKSIHTIVLFHDSSGVFSKPKTPLNKLILRNGHERITYFFNIHSCSKTNVPMIYKKNASCLFFFGGYSQLDFNSFFPQFKSNVNKKDLWEIYKGLSKLDVMLFYYTGDNTKIEILNLN